MELQIDCTTEGYRVQRDGGLLVEGKWSASDRVLVGLGSYSRLILNPRWPMVNLRFEADEGAATNIPMAWSRPCKVTLDRSMRPQGRIFGQQEIRQLATAVGVGWLQVHFMEYPASRSPGSMTGQLHKHDDLPLSDGEVDIWWHMGDGIWEVHNASWFLGGRTLTVWYGCEVEVLRRALESIKEIEALSVPA